MPYQPTGKPAGRPRKDGLPPGSVRPAAPPAQPVRPAKPAVTPQAKLAEAGPGVSRPGPFLICFDCYPEGWPKGATGLGCQHGIWSRPWVP